MAYIISYYQKGNNIDYTPASAVTAGTAVALNGFVGIALNDIAANVKGALAIKGVFAVPKKNEAMVVGLPVWFDVDGNPQGGTAGSGAATQIGGDAQAAGDLLLGTVVIGAAAADQYCYVDINVFDPNIPVFASKGARITKSSAANAAVTETGCCYDVATDAVVITLPATAVGLEFTLMNLAADGAALVEIDFQSGDKSLGGLGIAAGGDGKKLSNTKATAKKGDFITLVSDGTDGYRIKAIRGTWATEG